MGKGGKGSKSRSKKQADPVDSQASHIDLTDTLNDTDPPSRPHSTSPQGSPAASLHGSRSSSPAIHANVRRRSHLNSDGVDWANDIVPEVGNVAHGSNSQPVTITQTESSPHPRALILTLAPQVEFGIVSQYTRLSHFHHMLARAQNFSPDRLTLIELDSEAAQLDEAYQAFHSQHEAFASACNAAFFEHRYMTKQVYQQGMTTCGEIRQIHAKIRAQLTPAVEHVDTHDASQLLNLSAHLGKRKPEIPMPEFTGDYSQWPSFKDLFTSLVINDPTVDSVSRMHYLKTSVKGAANQLISTIPVSADSFDSAWDLLIKRYENKRLLISTHLDSLFQLKAPQSRSASALQALLNTVTEALNALEALGSPVQHWDQCLVHLIVQKIDSTTREAWENKLGSSTEFPSFTQLHTFLMGRARALERIEASRPEAKTTQQRDSRPPARTAHNVVTQGETQRTQPPSSFPCDCCQGSHYIVVCPKFRDLTPAARKKLVEDCRLCFNCLGHHAARSCNSSKTCRTCGERHHTMIHLNSKTGEASSQSGPSTSA